MSSGFKNNFFAGMKWCLSFITASKYHAFKNKPDITVRDFEKYLGK